MKPGGQEHLANVCGEKDDEEDEDGEKEEKDGCREQEVDGWAEQSESWHDAKEGVVQL